MAGPLRVTRSVVIPERELTWRFSRSSGPGGQSVNTADSRVELSLDVAGTSALGPVQRARVLERLAVGGDRADLAADGRRACRVGALGVADQRPCPRVGEDVPPFGGADVGRHRDVLSQTRTKAVNR